MLVLGIDPGFAITGWGIVEKKGHQQWKAIAFGAVKTKAGVPFPERLSEIFTQLRTVIERYSPEVVAVEQLFYAKNKKNTILISHARGAILLAASLSGIPVSEYSALQVKRAVVGYGRAEKIQIQKMVKSFLKLKEVPKPDDVADALAVAICHINSAKINIITSGIMK